MSIDFLPNRATPSQIVAARAHAERRARLFDAPKRIEAPVQVVEPGQEPDPEPAPEYLPLPSLTKPIFRDVISVGKAFKWRHIVQEVVEKHGISFERITSSQRHNDVCAARFEVCARLYDETGMSLPQIGRLLNKDHSTVFHAIRRHHAIIKAGAAQ